MLFQTLFGKPRFKACLEGQDLAPRPNKKIHVHLPTHQEREQASEAFETLRVKVQGFGKKAEPEQQIEDMGKGKNGKKRTRAMSVTKKPAGKKAKGANTLNAMIIDMVQQEKLMNELIVKVIRTKNMSNKTLASSPLSRNGGYLHGQYVLSEQKFPSQLG